MDSSSMKFIVLTIVGFMSWTCLFGQESPKKEKVYSLVKQKRTTKWYKQQADLWGEHLDKNPTDADAWLNYYTTNRMLKIYREGVTPSQLDSLVEQIAVKIPNTFEHHYIAFWNSGLRNLVENVKHLQKAQELGPDRIELHDDLMTYYQVIRDKENIKSVAHKWFASNDISPGIYAWCYNMLQCVDDNAFLITVGDNDTYPAWVLQEVKGVKPNVSVINASLITYDDYRERYFKELGLPAYEIDTTGKMDWHEITSSLIQHIKKHSKRPMYFSISAQKHLYEAFESEIYNVGMAYKWTETKFDNIAVTKKNYEKYMLLDYLKIDLGSDLSQGVLDGSNSHYLISFVTLYHHYVESEDPEAEPLKALILRIAKKSGKLEEIIELL